MGATSINGDGGEVESDEIRRAGVIGNAAWPDRRTRSAISTPTGLRLALAALVVIGLVFGAVGARAMAARQRAADAVELTATPLLVEAGELYVALADADAAASTAFLQAGQESRSVRDRYIADIEKAGEQLAFVSQASGQPPEARQALADIHKQLLEYTGRVEAARTYRRLEHVVGAAYLRRASNLMQEQILPEATRVYESAARALDRQQRTGSSADAVLALTVGAGLVVIVLVGAQVFVTRRSRRYVNVWLVAATLLTIVVGGVAFAVLDRQHDSLVSSQRRGSDPLIALSAARILALQSTNDQNLHLIERGTEPRYMDDFEQINQRIGGANGAAGLLEAAAASPIDDGARGRIGRIRELHAAYLAVHEQVDLLGEKGLWRDAGDLATTEQADASKALVEALKDEVELSRVSLLDHAAAARRAGSGSLFLVLTICVLAAGLSFVGLQARLREYR